MERRRFGRTAAEIPVIGQGTWYIDQANRGAAVAALRRGLDLGMTHIDTAEYYGEAENIVGEAIAGRRAEVFLVSKVVPEHATRAGTIIACEHSLSRLKTDRLDCYLLHWRGRHPLEETVAGFEQLYRDGKIRSFGVSNFDVEDLEEVPAITDGTSSATRYCITLKSALSNMLFYRGAKRTMSRSPPTALSVTAISPAPALLVAQCSPELPRRTVRLRARSHWPSYAASFDFCHSEGGLLRSRQRKCQSRRHPFDRR